MGSQAAWQALATRLRAGEAPDEWLSIGPGDANPYLTDNPHDLSRLIDAGAGPILLMLSGLGDGSYPLWRVSQDGEALALVLDVDLLPTEAERIMPSTADAGSASEAS